MILWKLTWLLLTLEFGQPQLIRKYTIGVVGRKWYDVLQKRLAERKDEGRVTVKLLISNYSIPFYENMRRNFHQFNQLGIHLVLGEYSLTMAQIANHLKLPYISTDCSVSKSNSHESFTVNNFYSLRMPDRRFSTAVIDLLTKFEITRVAVIIDSSVDYDSFVQPLFYQKLISIRLWSIEDEIAQDLSKLVKMLDSILEETRAEGFWDFVIKANFNVVELMILRAKYYGMLVHPNKWFLPLSLCYDINIAAIRQIHSNITMMTEECSESILRQSVNYTDVVIINKAIQIFRKIFWKLTPDRLHQLLKVEDPQLYDENGFERQSKLSLYTINFDESRPGNLILVGVWMFTGNESSLTYFFSREGMRHPGLSKKTHIRVSAVEEHPHLILHENGTMVGFGVDLLSELSKQMDFSYSISLTSSTGSKENSNWTGIVGELVENRADISLGPLVQTGEIEEVLDFSLSFKIREISLIMRKSTPSTSLFQFLSPFSYLLWVVCILLLLFITLALWGVEHIHDAYFTNEDDFPINLKESSWFSIACILKQQMDIFPQSIPGKIIHWLLIFFSLIIISSYTANLAAFLTIKMYPNPIKSVHDLARLPKNSEIIFGTVKDSPIFEFFEQSEMESFRKIYILMKQNPHWLVNDSRNGYKKALSEPYVFIWDDSVNQFEIFESEYNCSLISVGTPFGQRSFSIGMKFNSPLLEKINRNLLNIIESGKKEYLEKKWWKSNSFCSKESLSDGEEALSIDEMIGVFLIVVLGAVVSIVWISLEILIFKLKQRKGRKEENNTTKSNSEETFIFDNKQGNGNGLI